MTSNTEENCQPAEPKTIVYDYLFNYFGGDKYKGKIITGASIKLAICAYKNGKEVGFAAEPHVLNAHDKKIYYNQIYNISFDREHLYIIQKNTEVYNLFCLTYGWEKIEAKVVGYALECPYQLKEDENELFEDLPEELKDFPCTAPMPVTAEDFKDFLIAHLDDFDISDNINTQNLGVDFV